jgi:membrane protease YdiL (CAAX protease family)
MPFTIAILTTILVYVWMLEPTGLPVGVPAAIVVALTVWSGVRSGSWGLDPSAFGPALRAATLFTVPAAAVVLGIGAALGTLHRQDRFLENLVALIVWGGAQQWVLQTVVLREALRLAARRQAIVLAAVLFALVHLPNPLLSVTTFIGALAWCAIFARHPNILPLAISHALGTLAILHAFDDATTGHLRIGLAYLMLDR